MGRKKIDVVEVPERTDICKNCRAHFYNGDTFYCRRYPPTLMWSPDDEDLVSVVPAVAADHWCCEFLPILNG